MFLNLEVSYLACYGVTVCFCHPTRTLCPGSFAVTNFQSNSEFDSIKASINASGNIILRAKIKLCPLFLLSSSDTRFSLAK